MMIKRYQGWTDRQGKGAVNDHQKNEWVVKFRGIPKKKRELLLNACLEILNDELED